jgi:ribulose-bisphosphate carboxylase large chain
MDPQRITATYLIETPLEVEAAAAVLAGEQSSGTFVEVPGETEDLRQRYRARVERVSERDVVERPSLPGSRVKGAVAPGRCRQAEVVVSWNVENVGPSLPTLVSTLQGNLYELSQFSGLRLQDFDVPDSFADHFDGPRFGVSGTRRVTDVPESRPLVGTIVKPSVGLTPEATADLVARLAEAGVDFIKDDELMADPPHSPFDARVAAVMRVVNEHADRTGKRVMYAFNVSDELDAMLGHYQTVVKAGGSAAMVSVNSVGLAGVRKLCDQGALPVHGHRNGWGMLNRHPLLGLEFRAFQKLWRLAGVDHLHVNGLGNKFWEPDDSVVRSIEACREPFLGGFEILPVLSSGQWGGQAFETWRRTHTVDLLYLAGGGIVAHPDGPAGGVAAIRQAWDAAVAGRTLEDAAREHAELRHAVEKFGSPPAGRVGA